MPGPNLSTRQWRHNPFQPVLSPQPEKLAPALVPDAVKDIVLAAGKALEVPIELPLSSCLGVLATVCQGRWSVQIKPGWIEPTSVFIVTPADPGERKTPTLNIFTEPLLVWEKTQRDRCSQANEAAKTQSALIQRQIKQLERSASESDDLPDLARKIDELREQMPATEHPPRLFTDDTTPERLLRLMGENHGCMAILTDEGSAFLQQIGGRYNSGQPSIDGVLKGWDNGPIRVDRSNGNDVFLDHGRLSLLLLVQKSVAQDVLLNRDFMGRGLIHRCLWFLPSNDHIGNRSGDGPPVPDQAKSNWRAIIEGLLQWSPAELAASGTTTHVISMDDLARNSLRSYASKIEEKIGRLDEADPRRTYRQKWPGQVARIAGLLHCLQVAGTGEAPHASEITQETVRHAIALGEVLLDQADATIDLIGHDPMHERMRCILKRIESEGETTSADLWRSLRRVKSLFRHKSEFDKALVSLLESGYLSWRMEGKTQHLRLSQSGLEANPESNRVHRVLGPDDGDETTAEGD